MVLLAGYDTTANGLGMCLLLHKLCLSMLWQCEAMKLIAQPAFVKIACSNELSRGNTKTLQFSPLAIADCTVGFTSFLLAHPDNRDKQEKLLAEIDAFGRDRIPTLEDLDTLPYLDAVFKESLRLYPPAYLTTREAEEDFFMDGKLSSAMQHAEKNSSIQYLM